MTGRSLERFRTAVEDRSATVAIIGQGYVGLPVALRASELGFRVIGYDLDEGRIAQLREGRSYVEDVPDDQLAAALARGYLPTAAAEDLAGFSIAIISVPTPLRDGVPDLSYIEAAGRALRSRLQPGALVVLESTTYPGTTEELLRPILEADGMSATADFFLGYSPERIDPGSTTWTFVTTPKVVSGVDPDSLSAVESFYGALVDKVVPVSSTSEAELVKLLENTFRHVNIALVNELAMFARDLGVDVWSAIDAAATKPFGYMRFTPGPGVGGHCLPIDPSYLAWRVERRLGTRFRFVELANEVNNHMPDYVVQRIVTMLNAEARAVLGSRILVIGLAYKPGTSDWRESPAMPIVDRLQHLGAQVRAHDSHVPDDVPLAPGVVRVPWTTEELAAADLVVLLVDHPDLPVDEIARHARLVLDTRARMRGLQFRGEVL
jgi:UDP-N-acetyl-D-glucosamine dehydrogenase